MQSEAASSMTDAATGADLSGGIGAPMGPEVAPEASWWDGWGQSQFEAPMAPPFEGAGMLGPPSYLRPAAETGYLSLDTVLSPYVLIFSVAFLVAYIFTPIMRHVALAYGIVDQPDSGRKIHRSPVAYLGGVAVFLGFVSALAVCQIFTNNHHPLVPAEARAVMIPLALVASACVIVALGLLDDLRGVKPVLKILAQVAAAITLLAAGIGTSIGEQFVGGGAAWLHVHAGITMPTSVEQAIGYALSIVLVVTLVVFCCNASNLMDGLDGLCGGVTAIIAFGLVFVAAYLAMSGPVDRAPADAVRLVIALALFGAVLGFLPYNFNPASIFMGDTGSLFMGFTVAVSIILMGEVGAKWLLAGLVMFSLPVLDTALAFARRWVNRRPLFSADRHHFHHQLVMRGLTVRRAVVVSYALTIFFVISGVLLVYLRTRYAVAFYLVLFGCIIVAAYKMGMVHERPLPASDDGNAREEPSTGASSPDGVEAAGDEMPAGPAVAMRGSGALPETDGSGEEEASMGPPRVAPVSAARSPGPERPAAGSAPLSAPLTPAESPG